jgi:hypothetical protein
MVSLVHKQVAIKCYFNQANLTYSTLFYYLNHVEYNPPHYLKEQDLCLFTAKNKQTLFQAYLLRYH